MVVFFILGVGYFKGVGYVEIVENDDGVDFLLVYICISSFYLVFEKFKVYISFYSFFWGFDYVKRL